MAQSVLLGNKLIKLPGTYAQLISGVTKETPLASYSNVLLIDAGAGNGFNSIKGIIGNGKECIYTLDESTANYYIKGGPLAPVVNALYHPNSENSSPGIGKLYLVKAATTTAASVKGEISLFNGAITATSLKTIEQGPICNTEIKDGILRKGFLLKAIWKAETKKAYLEIYQGTYQGTNFGGVSIGNEEENSYPSLIYRSKKCSTPQELVTFLQRNSDFKNLIQVDGLIVAKKVFDSESEIQAETSLTFEGGTETYAKNLSEVFPMTIDVDYSCMFICEEGNNQTFAAAAYDHIINDAKGIKQLVTFAENKDDAINKAQEFDSDSVVMVSGVAKKTSKTSPTGFISHDCMVNAAYVIGRIFGLSPEIAGTMKAIDIDGMEIEPSDKDLEEMLDSGVISPYHDSDLGRYVISQAVNTLQANTQLINEDCSTYSIQAKRILSIVVKNLTYQSKVDFWKGDNPVNKATLSNAYVKSWAETLLNKLTYSQNKSDNNYLLSYEVIKVETVDDAKKVYLSVTINGEITKIFFLVTVLG